MKLNLKRFIPFTVVIALAAGSLMALSALKPTPPEEETEAPVLTVKVTPAALIEQRVSGHFQGEVRAKTDIELITQVTGKVIEVSDKFVEGGEFKAGETLLRIDDADYLVALKSAEAAVASAQVDLDLELGTAATNAKQWEALQGKPVTEANPLTLNKPQVDRARARLEAAEAELAQAKLNYDRTYISAPFDGRIIHKRAELGQFMARGSSLGRVFATKSMEIRIPMTDVQLAELGLVLGYAAPAESSGDRVPALVSAFFGSERQEWNGFLRTVDASVDNETRLVYATIVVERPFAKDPIHSIPLAPGLFVDVELDAAQLVAGVQIPRTSIRNGSEVYTADNGVLKRKPVSVIYSSTDFAIVREQDRSVQPNDRVITTPVPGAFNGMPIKVDGDEEDLPIASPSDDESSQLSEQLAASGNDV